MFDWVLLGSSLIGFFLEYSEIGFFLGSPVIGSSLEYSLESLGIGSSLSSSYRSSVTASYLVSSVLVLWYSVCQQLHQQLEGFYNGFLF